MAVTGRLPMTAENSRGRLVRKKGRRSVWEVNIKGVDMKNAAKKCRARVEA